MFILGQEVLRFEDIVSIIVEDVEVDISAETVQAIQDCRTYLDNKLSKNDALYYGINTGFGFLQNVKIDKDQIEQLQYNLLKSHACGIGDRVCRPIVKLMLFLKVKSLSFGKSGVQLSTVRRLIDMYNHNVLPVIYTQGSLGASGDLAPLSHLSLPLIGLGEVEIKQPDNNVWRFCPAEEALSHLNWQAIRLQSKEGLALINGTQMMSAYGIYCLYKSSHLIKMSNLIAALSFDAFDCLTEPLHHLIHSIRPHKGQIMTAEAISNYLIGSDIAQTRKEQIQDPYSFRCTPQVHGATIDAFEYILQVFMTEINSVTDNPNVFPEEDMILSGGNFHGQPLALSLDFLAIAMSELANISERRIYQLISGQKKLPLFLVKNPGLHSGFMIPQYAAASVVSENKQLATPASVDSISSSNNQEDHVSMGANAATKCLRVIENVEKVLAIELLTAVQALEFRRPLKSSPVIENLVSNFRKIVSFNEEDRVMQPDIMHSIEFIRKYKFN